MGATLDCWNIADLREKAQARLPRGIWEYAERGTEDECGMARNRAALDAVTFRPRVLRGVHAVNTRAPPASWKMARTGSRRTLRLPTSIVPVAISPAFRLLSAARST